MSTESLRNKSGKRSSEIGGRQKRQLKRPLMRLQKEIDAHPETEDGSKVPPNDGARAWMNIGK